jgi:hypothetical protein
MTIQINTATILAPAGITNTGNAIITVTAAGMYGSPHDVDVAVTSGDSAADVAAEARIALANDGYITAFFTVAPATGPYIELDTIVDAPNDPTINIASDNDTCAGLIPRPTSVHTQPGITDGYITLAEYKRYVSSNPNALLSVAVLDDQTIGDLIESASRVVDRETGADDGAWAFPVATIHKFDAPKMGNAGLMLDAPLLAITSLTNGDGSTVSASDYVTLPANSTPIYAILPVSTSKFNWQPDNSGNRLQAISVLGPWGMSAKIPNDLKTACCEITRALYGHRTGETMPGDRQITTASGLVITVPNGTPPFAADRLACHRRIQFG